MSDSENTKKEVFSDGVFVDVYNKQPSTHEPPLVQAFEDSLADPARSVATLALRDNSPVHVKNGSTEQEGMRVLQQWWCEQHVTVMAMRKPLDVSDSVLLAGDERFTLWRTDLERMQPFEPWRNARLYLLASKQEYPKRVWRLNYNREIKAVRDTQDFIKLEVHFPALAKWVRAVLLDGSRSEPPRIEMPTRRSWLKTRMTSRPKRTPEEVEARRRQTAKEAYAKEVEAKRRQQQSLADEMPLIMADVCLSALHELWEAKTPLSIRRQAGMQRFAPEILSKLTGVFSGSLEAWIKRMIAEGRIAEEVVCKKTKLRGLKVL